MRTAFPAAVGAIAAAAMLVATTGAAAKTAHPGTSAAPNRIDLSTPQAVGRYLRSLGIDPATVVVQRGVRNYAGPRCPGKRWNCTKARRVVQIGARRSASRALAANSFECTPSTGGSNSNGATAQSCVVIQTDATNSARCVEKSDAPDMTQTCTIDQDGTDNSAYILQDISTGGSSTSGSVQTQSGTQIATVTQKGTNNSLDATQNGNQSLSGTTISTLTQNQNAHQSIVVCQGASGNCAVANSGNNVSKIHQSRFASAHASGGTIVQNQDQAGGGTDCDPSNPPFQPSLCALVQQNSTTKNDSDLHQENHLQEVASGTLGSNVTQSQQLPSNGLDGHTAQSTSTAQNSNVSHQHQTDDMSAPPGAAQTQDPELGCCSSGGMVNGHQVAILRASEPTAQQNLRIVGNCESSGSCLMLAHGKINGSQAHDRCSAQASGESPAFCTTFVSCDTEVGCTNVAPTFFDLASLGFDTLDFTNAINFVFPLSLPLSPL